MTAAVAAALLALLGSDAGTCLAGAVGAAIGLRLFAWSHASDYEPRKQAAIEIVEAQIARLRAMSYRELMAHLDESSHVDVTMPDGEVVIRETELWLDDGQGTGNLRVAVHVWRPDAPNPPLARKAFIRRPDGSFVGDEEPTSESGYLGQTGRTPSE